VGAKDSSQKDASAKHKGFKVVPLKGRHVWSTVEGTVVIEEQGDTVLVSESLDAGTTATLEREVFGK
jgi:Na+-transporting NADH:ubiquinone oxidoreductase subunit NqrC